VRLYYRPAALFHGGGSVNCVQRDINKCKIKNWRDLTGRIPLRRMSLWNCTAILGGGEKCGEGGGGGGGKFFHDLLVALSFPHVKKFGEYFINDTILF
jgi:hypothetical protein